MNVSHRVLLTAAVAAGLALPASAQSPEQIDALIAMRQGLEARAQSTRAQQQAERIRRQQERLREQQERARQARASDDRPEATETFERTVAIGRNGTFDLQNVAGDIVISGGGNQVRIAATKRVRHPRQADARAALADVRIDVIERGGNVEVRTLQPRGRGIASAVDYTITVPNGASVVLSTVGGDIRASNVGGELRARSSGGSVTVVGAKRLREVNTVGGAVDITNTEADELTAQTLSGDIVVRDLKGRLVTLESVNGNVRLINVQLERAAVQSMAGDLEYSGRLARSGYYEFQTHSGNIRVQPAGTVGFDLDARTFAGGVRSDYTLKAIGDAPAARPGPARSLRGTFGDAGARLTVHSFSGDVLIAR